MNFYFWDQDESELAARAFDKSDPDGHVECLGRYAAFLSYRRRYDEAVTIWTAAHETILREGEMGLDSNAWPTIINCLTEALIKTRDYDKALEFAEPEAESCFELGKFAFATDLFMAAAQCHKKLGDIRKAVTVTRRAVEAANLSNLDWYMAESNLQLAKFALKADLLDIAKDAAEVADEKALNIDHFPFQTQAFCILGLVHIEKRMFIEAESALQKARAIARHTHDNKLIASVQLALGKLLSAMGDYKGAIRSLKKAYSRDVARHKKVSVEARWLAAEITSKYIDPEKGKKLQDEARHLLAAFRMETPRVNEKLF